MQADLSPFTEAELIREVRAIPAKDLGFLANTPVAPDDFLDSPHIKLPEGSGKRGPM